MKILYVEDDAVVAAATLRILKKDHTVEWANSTRQARIDSKRGTFDLLIIDITLPDGDGIELCRELREKSDVHSPILMLTADETPSQIASALDAGADDYLVKPFDSIELLARIRALSRRITRPLPENIVIGNTNIDCGRRELKISGKSFSPRKKEFEILVELTRNKDKAVSRSSLYEQIWDSNAQPISNTLDVQIRNLRKVLSENTSDLEIATLQGFGYMARQTSSS